MMTKLVTRGFDRLAQWRQARAFHPVGAVFEGKLHITDAQTVVGDALSAEQHDVLVRFSRGAGLPGRCPDFLGIAIRIAGPPPIDILMTSVGKSALGSYVLSPARNWTTHPFSTLLPYQGPKGRVVIALVAKQPRPGDGSLSAVRGLLSAGPLEFRVVERHDSTWRLVGVVTVSASEVAGEGMALDPMRNPVSTLRAKNAISAIREAAYVGSRRGRGGLTYVP